MKSIPVRYSHIIRKCVLFGAGTFMLISFFSCSTVKKIPKGQYLLSGTKIVYVLGSDQKNQGFNIAKIGQEGIEKFEIPQRIAPSEVLPYVKQKPNTKILFFIPFYLDLYNLPDSAKTARVKARKDSAYKIKALKKGWTDEKLKRKIEKKTGREWIMSQGEAPVILDSSSTRKSREQIRTFLFNKGYFDARVKDTVHYHGKKAYVDYIIKPGKPYKINNIRYTFEDPGLIAEIYSDTVDCRIRRGDVYDKDNFDAESDRLTLQLNNAGYYYFSKSYINCVCDTNGKTHLIDVTINIKRFVQRNPKNNDSVIETNHVRYLIRNVIIEMNYDPSRPYHGGDTIMYDGLKIVYPKGQLCMKPNKFRLKIFVTPGDVYRVINREDSYTGLSQLNEFSYISIKYEPVKDSNYLDSKIQLMPIEKLSLGAEFETTNTGGDFGIQGNVSYGDNNLFRGAEQLQFKLFGGLIAQKLLSGNNNNINKYIPLNTVDLGPELDLNIPRPLFPFSMFHYKRRVNPQSVLKLSFNYQQRPDYVRHILGASYSFDYNNAKYQHFTFTPIELSFVNANLSSDFAAKLQQYNLFLRNSFKNQVITDGRISWLINSQTNGSRKGFDYGKINFEFSGLVFDAFEHWHLIHLPVDNQTGDFLIKQFGAPFSQYIKLDGEYRHYLYIGKGQKLVERILAGVGYAYYNSTELPFSKSFWAGGSNDIRAWQVQTLGPGASQSSDVVGQIGDIKLEENIEYRVALIKYFGMAYFIDAGNIWLLKNKATEGIPLAYFQFGGSRGFLSPNGFMSEMAMGTGVGFRFDFTYFVIRFDFGQPVRDPVLPPSDRWIKLHDYTTKRTVFNFGIGYPF